MCMRALRMWLMTIALGAAVAATGAAAQGAPPANRLALVVGEAAYSGDALPTAGADAALVARSLSGDGFDVTELHDLATADLAQQYQAFVAKVAAAPPGAAVTVYFAGLGVTVGCDDYLLPVDAQIATEADVPRIALSMTRVMSDLAQTSSQLRLVMLDGARPVPGSVSAVAFPRGLIPLVPPAATTFGLSFWICLPLAGLLAALFGVALGFPVLRLRGDYLAIVTLGFGEMIRIILINWQSLTNGPNGLSSIPRPSFFGLPFERVPAAGVTAFHQFFGLDFSPEHRIVFLYLLILALALLTNLFVLRLRRLPLGRAWEALREDEIACRALGINPTNVKLSAFAIGAMLGGFAGAFFATRQGFISPESFTFIESATILAIVVLGGMGSQIGVVLAAAFLVLLPEIGREFAQFRMLIFGAAMILIMIWRPRGLLGRRDPTVRLGRPT